MNNFISDLKYRHSIIKYANRFGVTRASDHFNVSRSFIYKLLKRFDGTLDSIKPVSKRPHKSPCFVIGFSILFISFSSSKLSSWTFSSDPFPNNSLASSKSKPVNVTSKPSWSNSFKRSASKLLFHSPLILFNAMWSVF